MLIFNNIKKVLKKHGILMKDCAKLLEMSEPGFNNSINRHTLSLANFIRIMQETKIHYAEFFEEIKAESYEIKENANLANEVKFEYGNIHQIVKKIDSLEKKLDFLSKELDEKSQIIKGFMNGTITIVSK